MNTDDFEQRLRQQQLRPVPAAWRSEILSAARARAGRPIPAIPQAYTESLWNCICARFPVAWGTLAALWAMLIGANVLLSGPSAMTPANPVFARATEPSTVWQLQRAELRQLASDEDPVTVIAPLAPSERPRSDRRREERLGKTPKAIPHELLA